MNIDLIQNIEPLLRLLLAAFLGAIIGLERNLQGRAAGLRTHLLVSLGSALFTIISISFSETIRNSNSPIPADPARIAAQIVTGIGFLGAGAIIKFGINIRGLTTATCLWIAAAVGMAAGGGFYILGIFATFISLVTLLFLGKIDKFFSKNSYRLITIVTPANEDVSDIVKIVDKFSLKILYLDRDINIEKDTCTLRFSIKIKHKGYTDMLYKRIFVSIRNSNTIIKQIKWDHRD